MNHLLSFKKFESISSLESLPSDIQEDIFNIFLDLRDSGFEISYQYGESLSQFSSPHVSIYKLLDNKITPFKFSEIEETVNRVKNYLHDVGYDIKIGNDKMIQEFVIKSSLTLPMPNYNKGYKIYIVKKDFEDINESKIGEFFSKIKIKGICKKYGITNYTINSDLSIDVEGDVNLTEANLSYKDIDPLEKIPLNFRNVSGNFFCQNNNLLTLEGCPKRVGRSFNFSHNDYLNSFEGCPSSIGGNFVCKGNTEIYSFEGFPKHIGGEIIMDSPKSKWDPDGFGSPIFNIFNLFKLDTNLIEMFNDYSPIEFSNGKWYIIKYRLESFLEDTGNHLPNNSQWRILLKSYYLKD